MPDREKYIEILSKTVKTVKEYNEDTPIKISLECVEDILELLKNRKRRNSLWMNPGISLRFRLLSGARIASTMTM